MTPAGRQQTAGDALKVEAAVREALAMIQPRAAGLDGDADLAGEVGLDSVQVMDLIMEIEDRLDLSIPVETVAEARSVNELCAGILRLSTRPRP